MSGVVVIETGSGSRWLPGKALLDFRGLPLALLVARRAATRGKRVVLAASDHGSDDVLADLARAHGVIYMRGSRDDVLGRVVYALEGYSDTTTVIRLTADNLVPDGDLIAEVEQEFLARNLDYLTTAAGETGLPYGTAVEVTRLAHLREAAQMATDAYDRENATPYLMRKFGCALFLKYRHLGRGHFRATIDCLDDYNSMQRVFPADENPETVGWRTLVERMPLGLYQPGGDTPTRQFVLGTAQLGMVYGIANRSRPTDSARQAVLKTAIGNGVGYLDTARAYGRSEDVIGDVLDAGWTGRCRVVTKLSPLDDLAADASEAAVRGAVEASVLRSCLCMRQQRLDTLLLHRASHLTAWNSAVWNTLRDLQVQGLVGTLGVSVQSADELAMVLDMPSVAHIQLPFNILDWRWTDIVQRLVRVRAERSLVVHARSALLQGLLATDRAELWARAHVDEAAPVLTWLRDSAARLDRRNVVDLCLAYARAQSWIDGVVVGVDDLEQLETNLALFRVPPLTSEDMEYIVATRPRLQAPTLDPSQWKAA